MASGCTLDPTGAGLGKDVEKAISDIPVSLPTVTIPLPAATSGAPSPTMTTAPVSTGTVSAPSSGTAGSDWIFWREESIYLKKGGYSSQRPNLDGTYFRDLKVEVTTDAPVDVRFVTLAQSTAYENGWDDYYVKKTATSFNPQNVGYVRIFDGVSGGSTESVEAHGNEEIVIFVEPHVDMTAQGTMKIYYKL